MKIGIIGSGVVGKTLARGWHAAGHDVVVGTRRPDEHRDLEPAIHVTGYAEAAQHGDVLLVAVGWSVLDQVAAELPPAAVAGKTVMDATNPLIYRDGTLAGMETPPEGSAGQHLAARLPAAHVVKAFNVVGAPLMVAPQLPGGPPDMFICGDDEAAKRQVAALCDDLRYPAFDAGPLACAAHLEHLAMLWIRIAFEGRAKGHAFKLLRA